MKQVNPRLVNVTREFKYVTMDAVCKDFDDQYTDGNYKKTGCFGCKNLSGDYSISCGKGHKIAIKYIKKTDDNEIADGCNICSPRYRRGGYRSTFCDGCRNYYRGGGMGKCKLKNPIRKEVFRL